jgi:hypothetical protein
LYAVARFRYLVLSGERQFARCSAEAEAEPPTPAAALASLSPEDWVYPVVFVAY